MEDFGQLVRAGVLQERGLQERQASTAPRLRLPDDGEGARISRASILNPAVISRSIASEGLSSASHAPYVPSGSSAMNAMSAPLSSASFCGRGEVARGRRQGGAGRLEPSEDC
jgi:hypothetical protein